jgi:hypothetical protein
MLWFFVALQAMAPFIHAHAGAVQLNHAGFLHVHEGVHGDAAYHAMATAEHGEEVGVAQGAPHRHHSLDAVEAALPAVPLPLPRVAPASWPGAGLPAPPPFHLTSPADALPHATAPPAA